MSYLLYAIALFYGIGILFAINQIGKPRKPIGVSDVIFIVIFNSVVIAALVNTASQLH